MKVATAKNANRSDEQLALIQTLLGALEPFFQLRQSAMTVRSVQVFLLVAQKEGLSVTEYAKRAEMPVSSMSRNLIDMSEIDRHYEEGAGLIGRRENPLNRRENQYYLTPKGRALMASLSKAAR